MTPARIAQRLRQMAERYPEPNYSLSHPDLHNTVWGYIGPADDWFNDDEAQWSAFLLLVAADVSGVGVLDAQTPRAPHADAAQGAEGGEGKHG